ncbi:MAG TPA: hypothetical protein PKC62_12195, partial [Ferruginibacter sp.]|nr:hypothetical protein [Ferruginibacter sp.]
ENVLNFHSSDDSYYEEWFEQLEDNGGWVTILNMPIQSKDEFFRSRLTHYVELMEMEQWRTLSPENLFHLIEQNKSNRLDL